MLQSVLPAVKEECELLTLLFSVESLKHIDKESFHVLHLFLALDMFENAENQQFTAVFVSAKIHTYGNLLNACSLICHLLRLNKAPFSNTPGGKSDSLMLLASWDILHFSVLRMSM